MNAVKKMLVGAALVGASFGAQATVYDLGTLNAGYTDFEYGVSSGSFSDKISFLLSGQSDTEYGAGPLNYVVGTKTYKNISSLAMSLFDDGDHLIGTGLSFSMLGLNPGGYYLTVSGIANGINGGKYGGSINVSPVPEAETYSMMLVGLGLIGFIAMRRRTSV